MGRGMTTTGGAHTRTGGGAYTTDGAQTGTGGGASTTRGGQYTTGGGAGATTTGTGQGMPIEMPKETPACAGVASIAPTPTRLNAIMCFVFIVSRVFSFILARLDEGALGEASGV
jgi:hypothetical protein